MSNSKWTIVRVGDDEPIRFAAGELRKYLNMATGEEIAVRKRKTYEPAGRELWLGTFAGLGLGADTPDDDAIRIDAGKKGGLIAGSNPGSVVLAAYRFLTELGFRWVRPGKKGVLVPSLRSPISKRVRVDERAAYRHRTVCIEGASGWRHVRDMIDWMPKVGFNSYFVQFREGYTFFDRWYSHQENPLIKKERFTVTDARAMTRRIWDECGRRGMRVHMVGHGWTCEPFGIMGLGWYTHKGPIPAYVRRRLAEVDGKREFWRGVPMNTNLCYGDDSTRRIMADAVADYAAKHPHVDIIHLWLADGSNNHCECAKCREHHPADLYVKLLNEVDAELTRRNLSARIVFLIYVDLLWPPRKQRFVNPDRFILMFAPITRTYTDSFAGSIGSGESPPPFRRNKLKMPKSVAENLAFLRAWRRTFKGDSFDFDYHLMWDHFKDLGGIGLAKVLHADVRALRDAGLNGFNSCQVQRCFFPSGLLMTVMGRTLWNRDLTYDEIAIDHFKSAFGKDWRKVKRHLAQLSELFDPPFLRRERNESDRKDTLRKLDRLPAAIQRFKPVIEANLRLPEPCHAQSWAYLKEHADICLALAPVVEAAALADEASLIETWNRLLDLLRRKERRVHPVLDVCLMIKTIGVALGVGGRKL
jgi:hypothetical protein